MMKLIFFSAVRNRNAECGDPLTELLKHFHSVGCAMVWGC